MNIETIKTEENKEAILCSVLYENLGLDYTMFTRWTKRNLLNSKFAIENVDFIQYKSINSSKNNLTRPNDKLANSKDYKKTIRRKQDYVLTIDFAKRLAMMCRTEKGEEVRTYFLKCEALSKEKESKILNHLKAELITFRRIEEIRVLKIAFNKEQKELKKVLLQPQVDLNEIKSLGSQLELKF
jgi:phage anti-repressor protein